MVTLLIKKGLKNSDLEHEGKVFDKVSDPNLKWLHIVISNAKSFIVGTYHGLKKQHLQKYLDGFCYHFNRRKFALQNFNRLLFACSTSHKLTYSELTR